MVFFDRLFERKSESKLTSISPQSQNVNFKNNKIKVSEEEILRLFTIATGNRSPDMDIARRQLVEMGSEAVEPIINIMKKSGIHYKGCSILGDIGDIRGYDILIAALENDDTRSFAVSGLGNIGDERAIDPVIKCLNDNDHYVRFSSVRSLGQFGGQKVKDALLKVAIHDTDKEIRDAAEEELLSIDPTMKAKIRAFKDEKGVELKKDGSTIYDLIHSSTKSDKDHPITIKGSDAIIYSESEKYWYLLIPTKFGLYNNRIISLSPDTITDNEIIEIIKESPNWSIGTNNEGKIYKLLTSKYTFDHNNKIYIGDNFAQIYKDYHDEWILRKKIGPGREREYKIGEIGPINEEIDAKILDVVAFS